MPNFGGRADPAMALDASQIVTGNLALLRQSSGVPVIIFESAGVYPARPVTPNSVWFVGKDTPASGGSTTSGTGIVSGLDFWFKTS